MRSVRREGTAPELALRAALTSLGARWEANQGPIDVSVPDLRLAIFVHGCFWHGCPLHWRVPATRGAWWRAKVDRNKARDRADASRIVAAGWRLAIVWEHELGSSTKALAAARRCLAR